MTIILPMKTFRRLLNISFYGLTLLVGMMWWRTAPGYSQSSSIVHLITLDDATINPVTADYIVQAIDQAQVQKAQCLILQLDTPGGLLSSTRLIVKRMLSSTVPLVVYIAPSGSRAGSAGVFLTYASHVAAMAPSTNIGAAHPVSIGFSPDKVKQWRGLKEFGKSSDTPNEMIPDTTKDVAQEFEEIVEDQDPMDSKILNDTVAFIRAIAQQRGRNEEWAVKSVTASASITEQEALMNNVVDLVVTDVADLLQQLDGRQVQINGQVVTLATAQATVLNRPMDVRQKFFNILANPNIAYLLMILGFYGLLFEVTHPGIGVPGILGSIFLILAFYSMQMLPMNYAGLALLLLGLILLVAEAFVPGFGLLTLGGVTSTVLGSMLLFDATDPVMRVSLSVIALVAGTAVFFSLVVVRALWQSIRRKVSTGREGLLQCTGDVQHAIVDGKEGKVFVHGELWNAVSNTNLKVGTKIKVMQVNGMVLTVEALTKGESL